MTLGTLTSAVTPQEVLRTALASVALPRAATAMTPQRGRKRRSTTSAELLTSSLLIIRLIESVRKTKVKVKTKDKENTKEKRKSAMLQSQIKRELNNHRGEVAKHPEEQVQEKGTLLDLTGPEDSTLSMHIFVQSSLNVLKLHSVWHILR